MRKPNSVLGGVALALALTLTACSDEGTDPDAQDTPTAKPSTTPTDATPTTPPDATPTPKTDKEKASAVLQRYLEFRDDAFRSGKSVDSKALNRLATGTESAYLQRRTIDIQAYDIKVTGEYGHALGQPRQRTGTTTVISDCEDRAGVTETKEGKKVPPPVDPNGKELHNPIPVEYEVVKQRGRWLVSSSDVRWRDRC